MAIIEVVKFEGDPSLLAWKYPNVELGTWTQLIVNEAYEAVLFKGGKACDVFMAGRHTLETANIPILNNLVNMPFGGKSPFAAEVWYVNKKYALDVKWGTATPIQIQDPKYNLFLPLRSFGQFGIQVTDSKKFLIKLTGTLNEFSQDTMKKHFKGLYLTNVKDAISSYLIKNNVSALEINAYLLELSNYLQERMAPVFSDYGIQLVNFYVNDISVPENDSAVMQLKAALAKKAEMDIIGYDYVQERSFNALQGAATNPGSSQSGFMGAGLGVGMGVSMGGAFGGAMSQLSNSINTNGIKKCPKCNSNMNSNSRFCSTCGFDTIERPAGDELHNMQATVSCAECSTRFPKTAKFCPECGNAYRPCSNCGADLPESATDCPSCGTAKSKPCPKCSAIIAIPNVKFCPECGNKL